MVIFLTFSNDDNCPPKKTGGWVASQVPACKSIDNLIALLKAANSWILNLEATSLGEKAKATLPLRTATLKQQAMITRHSGNLCDKRQASLKPAYLMLHISLVIVKNKYPKRHGTTRSSNACFDFTNNLCLSSSFLAWKLCFSVRKN